MWIVKEKKNQKKKSNSSNNLFKLIKNTKLKDKQLSTLVFNFNRTFPIGSGYGRTEYKYPGRRKALPVVCKRPQ